MMRRFTRSLPAAALLAALALPALAGTSTITVLDSAGATKTYDVVTDGSGHFVSEFVLCDQAAAANCQGVNSSNQAKIIGSSEGATGAAVPANATLIGAAAGSSGNLTGLTGCNTVKTFNTSSSGLSSLVAISGSKATYVCGVQFFAGGTTAPKLIYGTHSSTACDTGATDITAAAPMTAQTGYTYANPFYTGLGAPASNELCLNNGSAAQITGFITYSQF